MTWRRGGGEEIKPDIIFDHSLGGKFKLTFVFIGNINSCLITGAMLR
jgi:hypothetical protein